MTDEDALTPVTRWAPLLRLHKYERHLPSDPEIFRESARFRESRYGKSDKGWNKNERTWKKGDQGGSEYHAPDWEDVVQESELYILDRDPNGLKTALNARPLDDNNVYGPDHKNGLFLQRSRDLSQKHSGMKTRPSLQIDAPVYIDVFYDNKHSMVRVLYWFFYELNHWHFMITHEGDWEHITMIYPEERFRKGLAPGWVYLAQHNHGEVYQYVELERYDTTHRVIYVDKAGHPCHVRTEHKRDYIYEWKTWESDRINFIPRARWKDFAGAWGEIGETKHTTGPLGPAFKRKDKVRLRQVGLKSYIVVKR